MPHFMVLATDRPDATELRTRTRPQHRLYLRTHEAHSVQVLLAGPTFGPSGTEMNGTLLVVDAASVQDVLKFIADDPYSSAGLFAQVDVRPWVCGLGTYAAEDGNGRSSGP